MTRMGVVMFHKLCGAALALVALAVMAEPAAAVPGRIGQGVLLALPSARHLADGTITAPPRAFDTFCTDNLGQCTSNGGAELFRLDAERWAELDRINGRVNRHIRPRADAPGTDVWTLGADAGDCDDYAVEKRRELIDHGWPTASLALTVAFLRSGEPHLVLTVRTDRGDFVLDNLRDRVIAADRADYRWIARQSTIHPRLWVRIDGVAPDDFMVAEAQPKPVPAAAEPEAPNAPVVLVSLTPKTDPVVVETAVTAEVAQAKDATAVQARDTEVDTDRFDPIVSGSIRTIDVAPIRETPAEH